MIETKLQVFAPTHALLTDSTRHVILPSVTHTPATSSTGSGNSSGRDANSQSSATMTTTSSPSSSSSLANEAVVRLVPGTRVTGANRAKEMAIMRLARNRLDTFSRYKYPDRGIPFSAMAEAGFFCRAERPADAPDQAECIFCSVKISNWSPGMDPIEQHIKFSERCEFVMGYHVNNIPIDGKTSSDPIRGCNRTRHRDPDICGSGSNSPTSPSPTPSHQQLQQSSSLSSSTVTHQGPVIASAGAVIGQESGPQSAFGSSQMRHQNPAFPRYVTYDTRIRTFPPDWQSVCPVPADKLSEAGFFYNGVLHDVEHGVVKDAVTCFHCRRVIFNWESGDDPWSEHQRLVSSAGLDCYFLRLNCERPVTASATAAATVTSSSSSTSGSEFESLTGTLAASGSAVSMESEASSGGSGVNSGTSSPTNSEAAAVTPSATPPALAFAEMGRALGSLAHSYENREPSSGRDNGRCKVCYGADIEILFLPCRHANVCANCAAAVDRCPYCRAHIDGSVRIFIS